ncbi:MAG: type II toxin-antitoxin system Phd/YefM family antitoxin [Spirochaetaceae bacterium]|jgi:prevent-host-death family protein|nr:type II toxin-antitoxin system Phd/YefM family antitoxin [Spirochaetaceae bacterium]
MPQIIPIKELRNTNEISRICHEKDEPIFVTKNGYGDIVLMSMETYERNMARTDLLNKIAEGEEDLKKGDLLESGPALKSLRNEFFNA